MKRSIVLFFFFISMLLLGSCTLAGAAGAAQGTPTATPFLPSFPATPAPEQEVDVRVAESHIDVHLAKTVGFGGFALPSEPSDIDIPAPMDAIPKREDQINILLLGSDQRPNDGGFRTDAIELLTLSPKEQSASLIAFPRDLYVYQPGWRMNRINAAMVHGDFKLLADTFAYNFGVRPDYYILINFQGFVDLINALGGIDVQVASALTDERDGPGDFTVPAAIVHMDGETALWYVRSRGTSSDYDRTRRQQEVLTAILFRLLSLDVIANAPKLYEQYQQMVQTDLALTDLLSWLPLALTLSSDPIHRFAIGPNEVTPWTTSNGGAVLLPIQELIRPILIQALHAQ